MKAKPKPQRSDAQIKAIRRNYAIRANKAKQQAKRTSRTSDANKPKPSRTNSSDKKELPTKIKKNPWNVHYINNNDHSHIIIASKNKEAMALGTTSEVKDSHSKIKINDGLVPNQDYDTYVKTSAKVIPSKSIQKKKPNSRITPRDKELIFNSIKGNSSNVEKYENLGLKSEEKDKKKN